MRYRAAAVAVGAFLVFSASAARAQTATATISVSATIGGTCTASAGALNFGNYDPATRGNASSVLSLTCLTPVNAQVTLSGSAPMGSNTWQFRGPTGFPSAMRYTTLEDPISGQPWFSGLALPMNPGAQPEIAEKTLYAVINPGQPNEGPGLYSDTITATFNF